MKKVRVWLSLWLALLLPVQGAVGAAMLCPHPSMAAEQRLHAGTGHEAMDHEAMDHAAMDHGAMADVQAPHGRSHDHHGPAAGACGLCAACCSGAALASVWPSEFVPLPKTEESYPAALLPATSFLSDGQERPPRSC